MYSKVSKKTLSETIYELRKSKNLTQSELGKEINVTLHTVAKWENGESIPKLENIKSLAKLFNVSIDFLLSLEGSYLNNMTIVNDTEQKKKNRLIPILICLLLLIGGGMFLIRNITHVDNMVIVEVRIDQNILGHVETLNMDIVGQQYVAHVYIDRRNDYISLEQLKNKMGIFLYVEDPLIQGISLTIVQENEVLVVDDVTMISVRNIIDSDYINILSVEIVHEIIVTGNGAKLLGITEIRDAEINLLQSEEYIILQTQNTISYYGYSPELFMIQVIGVGTPNITIKINRIAVELTGTAVEKIAEIRNLDIIVFKDMLVNSSVEELVRNAIDEQTIFNADMFNILVGNTTIEINRIEVLFVVNGTALEEIAEIRNLDITIFKDMFVNSSVEELVRNAIDEQTIFNAKLFDVEVMEDGTSNITIEINRIAVKLTGTASEELLEIRNLVALYADMFMTSNVNELVENTINEQTIFNAKLFEIQVMEAGTPNIIVEINRIAMLSTGTAVEVYLELRKLPGLYLDMYLLDDFKNIVSSRIQSVTGLDASFFSVVLSDNIIEINRVAMILIGTAVEEYFEIKNLTGLYLDAWAQSFDISLNGLIEFVRASINEQTIHDADMFNIIIIDTYFPVPTILIDLVYVVVTITLEGEGSILVEEFEVRRGTSLTYVMDRIETENYIMWDASMFKIEFKLGNSDSIVNDLIINDFSLIVVIIRTHGELIFVVDRGEAPYTAIIPLNSFLTEYVPILSSVENYAFMSWLHYDSLNPIDSSDVLTEPYLKLFAYFVNQIELLSFSGTWRSDRLMNQHNNIVFYGNRITTGLRMNSNQYFEFELFEESIVSFYFSRTRFINSNPWDGGAAYIILTSNGTSRNIAIAANQNQRILESAGTMQPAEAGISRIVIRLESGIHRISGHGNQALAIPELLLMRVYEDDLSYEPFNHNQPSDNFIGNNNNRQLAIAPPQPSTRLLTSFRFSNTGYDLAQAVIWN